MSGFLPALHHKTQSGRAPPDTVLREGSLRRWHVSKNPNGTEEATLTSEDGVSGKEANHPPPPPPHHHFISYIPLVVFTLFWCWGWGVLRQKKKKLNKTLADLTCIHPTPGHWAPPVALGRAGQTVWGAQVMGGDSSCGPGSLSIPGPRHRPASWGSFKPPF